MDCMALYKWIRWLYFHGLGGSATMEYSKIPDQSDLQIIEQTGNTYKLEVNSVMEVLSNLEKQGVQVKNITQIHKTLEDVYNEFIQEASL